MTWLLDTNTVSDLRPSFRRPVDPGLAAWFAATAVERMQLSSVTVLELEIGVRRKERSDPRSGARLRQWLTEIIGAFESRVLAFDTAAALAAAPMHVPSRRPDADSMIAGIARSRRLVVVTRKVRDFESLGVEVLSPWSA